MINKIKDIPYGTEVWVKMKRVESRNDDHLSLRFDVVWEGWDYAYLDDENEVLTEEEMRERFSVNGWMPKQGEMIEVKHNYWDYIGGQKFVCLYKWKVIIERADAFFTYDEWRYPEKETVTLSNGKTYFVEERGDEMVLILKD